MVLEKSLWCKITSENNKEIFDFLFSFTKKKDVFREKKNILSKIKWQFAESLQFVIKLLWIGKKKRKNERRTNKQSYKQARKKKRAPVSFYQSLVSLFFFFFLPTKKQKVVFVFGGDCCDIYWSSHLIINYNRYDHRLPQLQVFSATKQDKDSRQKKKHPPIRMYNINDVSEAKTLVIWKPVTWWMPTEALQQNCIFSPSSSYPSPLPLTIFSPFFNLQNK